MPCSLTMMCIEVDLIVFIFSYIFSMTSFFPFLGLLQFFHLFLISLIFSICLILLKIFISWIGTDNYDRSKCIVWISDFCLKWNVSSFLTHQSSSSVGFDVWELYMAKFEHMSSRVVLTSLCQAFYRHLTWCRCFCFSWELLDHRNPGN